jgi:hypothetical protein
MMTLTEMNARRERAYELTLNARLEARAALQILGDALKHARIGSEPDDTQEALARACDSLEETLQLIDKIPTVIDSAISRTEETLLGQGRAIAATGTRIRVGGGRLQ